MPTFTLTKRLFGEPVAVAIATRIWTGAAGLVSLYLLARTFSEAVQGFYYTFLSLIGLQAFAELGLLIVVVVAASHESARLSIHANGDIEGDPAAKARLAALGRAVIAWFGVISLFFAAAVGLFGFYFLGGKKVDFEWQLPWAITIVAAAANLWGSSFVALREGCNQVASVTRFRLVQSASSAFSLWIAILSGAGIWSVAISTLIFFGCFVVYIAFQHRRFFLSFLRHQASTLSWRPYFFTMQWPLALQGVGNYFMFSLFVPVIFEYRGAEEAGRMGMSLQVLAAIAGIATTWLAVATPSLGGAASRNEYRGLERKWARTSALSMSTALLGGIFLLVTLSFLSGNYRTLTEKVLPVTTFAIFLAWMLNNQLILCLASYWRALKSEPIGYWGFLPGLVGGTMIWWAGKTYGSSGTAWAALGSGICVTLPLALYAWHRAKKRTRLAIHQ